MKTLIFIAILLIASIWVGINMAKNPGYVLITYEQWSIETTLWVAIIATLLLMVVLYFALKLIRGTLNIPSFLRIRSRNRAIVKAQKRTIQGFCQLVEGQYLLAEKNLLTSARDQPRNLINFIAAAKSAQNRKDYDKRDHYLSHAEKGSQYSKTAVALVKAKFQIQADQLGEAEATLNKIHLKLPHHPQIIKQLAEIAIMKKEWLHVKGFFPALKKYKLLNKKDLETLEIKTYKHLLREASHDEIEKIWRHTPNTLQQNEGILLAFVHNLMQHDKQQLAANTLKKALKNAWLPNLILAFGELDHIDAIKQLHSLEAWLPSHDSDPILLLALGRVCMRNSLWGKAKSFLETSIKIKPSQQAYKSLGELNLQLDEPTAALEHFQQGLEFTEIS